MGYAISWIAIKGLDKAETYKRLDMKPTGEIGDVTEFNGAHALPGGWTLIMLDRMGHPLVQAQELEELSAHADVIACNIEEHVGFSSAEAWKDGACLWRIAHDAGSGDVSHLEVEGGPPVKFSLIDQKYRRRQKAEGEEPQVDHMFEIPLAFAASITGFKHDETDIDDFELLEWEGRPMVKSWKPKQLKPWWQFWK